MKTKVILVLVALFSASGVFAQSNDSAYEIKSIFGGKKGKNRVTGFAAFMVQGHSLPERNDAVWTGLRGGVIFNHNFAISVGGMGLASNNRFSAPADSGKYNLEGGYGGIYFEPILASRFPIHLSFPCMIGVGGMAYTKQVRVNDPDVYFDRYENTVTVDDDAFFVFEPGVSLELNITKHSRIGFNAKYRFTQDFNLVNTSSSLLDGWNGGVTLKFGRF